MGFPSIWEAHFLFMFGSRVSSRGKIDQNRFEEPLEITLGKLILNKENVYRWYWIEIKRN